jgi:hypothetical protein
MNHIKIPKKWTEPQLSVMTCWLVVTGDRNKLGSSFMTSWQHDLHHHTCVFHESMACLDELCTTWLCGCNLTSQNPQNQNSSWNYSEKQSLLSEFLLSSRNKTCSPANTHILQDINEHRVWLSMDLVQLKAEMHTLVPCRALETEASSFLIHLPCHRRQLQKISTQDQLQPSKWAVVSSHHTCNSLQLL